MNYKELATDELLRLADDLQDQLEDESCTDADAEAELELVNAELFTRLYSELPKASRDHNGLPVLNHRVEQLVRAVYMGTDHQRPTANEVGVVRQFPADDLVIIGGRRDDGKLDFFASTNTRLAMLGINARAVLNQLGKYTYEGEPALIVDANGFLSTRHIVLCDVMQDVNRNYRNGANSTIFAEYINDLREGRFNV